jgi:acetyl esterase/lipase
MARRLYRNLAIGAGILVVLVVALGLTVYIGGAPLMIRIAFAWRGTTSPVTVLQQQPTNPAKRISYGPDDLQFGELRLPDGPGKHPVAIIVHGGCFVNQLQSFQALDSAYPQLAPMAKNIVSLALLRPLALALTKAGFATWNIEYRRIGDPGGGWPGTYKDVSAAVDFLSTLAAENNLDLSRVIVIGHSAGGHLAEWVAGRRNLLQASPLYAAAPLAIAGVVDIDGPPDLEAAPPGFDSLVCGEPVVSELLGGSSAEVPSHYREGSVTGQLPTGIRQELLYAGKNEFTPKQAGQWSELFTSYASIATKAGDPVRVVRMEKAGHFDGINPRSKSWPTVMASINSLLGAH